MFYIYCIFYLAVEFANTINLLLFFFRRTISQFDSVPPLSPDDFDSYMTQFALYYLYIGIIVLLAAFIQVRYKTKTQQLCNQWGGWGGHNHPSEIFFWIFLALWHVLSNNSYLIYYIPPPTPLSGYLSVPTCIRLIKLTQRACIRFV